MTEENRYLLGESQNEHSRLRDQSVVFDPLTRQLLIDAGITEGMSVLDIGTGAGAVAGLAADLVGPDGHVLAVDRDPSALDGARTLLGHRKEIDFAEADLSSLALDEEFDAIVGRTVLMHTRNPVEVLERLSDHLRAGGLMVMHELDVTHDWASVSTPLWEWVRSLILETFEENGIHNRMGPDLFAAFRAAGLPDPHLTWAHRSEAAQRRRASDGRTLSRLCCPTSNSRGRWTPTRSTSTHSRSGSMPSSMLRTPPCSARCSTAPIVPFHSPSELSRSDRRRDVAGYAVR